MTAEATEQDRPLFLSALPASPGDHRLALAVAMLSTVVFMVAAPLAKASLPEVWAFLPIYQSVLVINDLITAVLLYGQFGIVRSRALLALASGYLFSAFMAVVHLLSFPQLFTETGLLDAGPQTAAWLYFLWHGVFPLFIIAYALLEDEPGRPDACGLLRSASLAIVSSVVAVALIVGAFTLLTTGGHDVLPAIMHGNQDAAPKFIVAMVSWAVSLVALVILWRHRPRLLLDLWLMVVMCVWIFDTALSSVLNAGRFDVGWYTGRVYGLLATSFVLMVLLHEHSILYAALIETHASERKKAAELERLTVIDALTGIANRRAFDRALDQEWRRTVRHGTPLSLLLVDVDCFKRFNDTYGHIGGDHCLQAIAAVLGSYARRAGEVAARYGGEEFAVLLPHTDESEALSLAQRLCQGVRDLNIPHANSTAAPHVTISVGVASAARVIAAAVGESSRCTGGEQDLRLAARCLVETADQALYAAKETGRNRAVSAGEARDKARQSAA